MISVIIPIYNAEPYLSRCIDSVLCSGYTDFELILVDDGSTDGCLRICQAYAERDPRITVLSQKNQGVSAARNRGLELCRGEWVVFVDADDRISPDHLSLVAGTEDADLLLFDFAEDPEELTVGPRSGKVFRYGSLDISGLVERVLTPRQLRKDGQVNFRSSNAKAFKKEIIDRCGLRFDPDISYGEDKLFNLNYIFRIERFAYLPVPVYFYETHPGSLTHTLRPDALNELITLMEKLQTVLEQYSPSTATAQFYNHWVLDHICFALTDLIFSSPLPKTPREQYAICAYLRKKTILYPALKQNLRLGPLERRIFLFFFSLGWYRAVRTLHFTARLRQKLREYGRIAVGNE